jgi:hypothetical protein
MVPFSRFQVGHPSRDQGYSGQAPPPTVGERYPSSLGSGVEDPGFCSGAAVESRGNLTVESRSGLAVESRRRGGLSVSFLVRVVSGGPRCGRIVESGDLTAGRGLVSGAAVESGAVETAVESGAGVGPEGVPDADESGAVESGAARFCFRWDRSFWARFASGVSEYRSVRCARRTSRGPFWSVRPESARTESGFATGSAVARSELFACRERAVVSGEEVGDSAVVSDGAEILAIVSGAGVGDLVVLSGRWERRSRPAVAVESAPRRRRSLASRCEGSGAFCPEESKAAVS